MTSAPDGGDASGSTPRMRSFFSSAGTFVHTLPLPSMSFPNRRYCVAATAWDASAINASLRSVLLMDRVSVQGPRPGRPYPAGLHLSIWWARRLGMDDRLHFHNLGKLTRSASS